MVAAIAATHLSAVPARAQEEHPHEDPAAHDGGLHFSHPLIVESISPDTKVRLDYFFRDVAIGGGELEAKESTIRFEGEYALHHAFSIEVNVPYTILDEDGDGSVSDFGSAEIALKADGDAREDDGEVAGPDEPRRLNTAARLWASRGLYGLSVPRGGFQDFLTARDP